MSLSAKVGNFSLPVSTGNYSITGLGFQPKIVIFMAMGFGGGGTNTKIEKSFGWALSSSARRSMCWYSQNNVSTSYARRGWSDSKCLHCYQVGTSATLSFAADFVSMDSDGFTINVTTAPPSGYRVEYLALGGSDITNQTTDRFDLDTSISDQSITGLGFQPDFLLLMSTLGTTNTDFSSGDITNGIGFAAGTTKQSSISWSEDNGVSTTDVNRYQRDDSLLAMLDDTGAEDFRVTLKSFDSDGFTLQKDNAPGSNRRLHYLAIKGGSWHVGKFLSRTSTGSFSETGVGFQAKSIFLGSVLNAASTSPQVDGLVTFGMASSSTERNSNGFKSEDGLSTTDLFMFQFSNNVYNSYSPSGTVREGYIDFTSFDSDGFTLNQQDADPSAKQIVYFAGGDTGIASQTIEPNGIASAEAFGGHTITTGNVNIAPSGIASAEAFGSHSVSHLSSINPMGIESAELWGTPDLTMEDILLPVGIVSGESWGTHVVSQGGPVIQATSIDSGEVFGSHTVSIGQPRISPIGIGSAEAFGFTIVNRGSVDLAPNSINSTEAFGSATITSGNTGINLTGGGIPSEEVVPPPRISLGVTPSSILSQETFGSHTVLSGNVDVAPTGIVSGEFFGNPTLLTGDTGIISVSIESEEAFGDAVVSTGNIGIAPVGIESSEAFGTQNIVTGNVEVLPIGITTGEAFGSHVISAGGFVVQATSIEGAEAFGTPQILTGNTVIEQAGGIVSEEAFGTAEILQGSVSILPNSIGSAEDFGSVSIGVGNVNVSPSGIVSEENWGSVTVSMELRPNGIPSEEDFGIGTFTTGNVDVFPLGIGSEEAFGSSVIRNLWVLEPEGIGSQESFGTPLVRIVVLNEFQTMMENDLQEVFFNDTEFAEHASYEYKSGKIFDLVVIFDNSFVSVDPGTGAEFISRDPRVMCQTSDFTEAVRKGDKIVVRNERYEIVTVEPDGVGVTTLQLHKEKTI